MLASEQTHKAYADNFYKAVCQKDGNTEVIWCRDYVSPGQTHQFTKGNLPKSIEQDTGSDRLSVLLNLVEAFEPLDATEEQKGRVYHLKLVPLKIRNSLPNQQNYSWNVTHA